MRRKDQGVALLLVIGAVAILSALAVELAARANLDAALARRVVRDMAFRRTIDSGVEVGKALLTEPEAKAFDFWGERWNERVAFSLGFQESAAVRVQDESGKLNLLKTDPAKLEEQLRRLFTYLRRRRPGRTETWKRIEGAVFARLALGVTAKEGESPPKAAPFLTLDSLREAGLSAEEVFGEEGLHRYLTTLGDGKINLNTAPAAVLYALDSEVSEEIADRIAAYRGDPEGEQGSFKPFEQTRDLELVDGVVEWDTIDGRLRAARNLHAKLQGQLSVKSTAFSIRVEARIGDRRREAWAFFEPGRIEQAGEKPRRTLKRFAFEELRP